MDKYLTMVFLLVLSQAVSAFNDPTRPRINAPVKKVTADASPKSEQPLTAIFTRNKKRFAIIEGQVYRRGDNYRDSRIVKITAEKVFLRSAQGSSQLTLIPTIKSK